MRVSARRLWVGGVVIAALAGLATLIVFTFAADVVGVDIQIETPGGAQELRGVAVLLVAFGAGLVATAALWLCLRFLERPTMVFSAAGLVVFLASLLAPLTSAEGDVWWLVVLHLVAYGMIVGPLVGLVRSAAGRL